MEKSAQKLAALISLPFSEVAFAAALAVIFFFASQPILSGVAGVIGAFVAFSRFAFQEHLKEELAPLSELRGYVDLRRGVKYGDISSLVESYASITEPEFRLVKEQIVGEAGDRLRVIAIEKKSDELATGEYYSWLIPIVRDAHKGELIRAVSIMHDSEWDESPAEEQWFEAQIQAAARGVRIERVFIVPSDKKQVMYTNEKVRAHFSDVDNGLHGYVVDLAVLERQDAKLLAKLGEGFISIGDRVALVDRFDEAGGVRGQVTMKDVELKHLARIFSQLRFHATELRPLPELTLADPPRLLETSAVRRDELESPAVSNAEQQS